MGACNCALNQTSCVYYFAGVRFCPFRVFQTRRFSVLCKMHPPLTLHKHPMCAELQVSRSCIGSSVIKTTHFSSISPLLINSSRTVKQQRRRSPLLVAESDRIITDGDDNSSILESVGVSPNPAQSEEVSVSKDSRPPASEAQSTPKKVPLTARERLRAARVLSRYSDPKPAKPEMGRSVLDALKESDKGKKGLPEAPTNLFDDSKRGLPKPGLTFNFPGGFDLFVIAFSFVFISTVMFATTYLVWKVGAIHFNEY